MDEKKHLRDKLRKMRREHVASLPDAVRGLVFYRPPTSVTSLIPHDAVIGLYHAHNAEAPTMGYARWFHEQGHTLALPRFANRKAPMRFHAWHDPYDDDELETGPFGMLQPSKNSPEIRPDAVFVPLVGFTADGERLGQGGGHYDRWLARHPDLPAIGLAWDCQLVKSIPVEHHDHPLRLIVTPTRSYEGTPDA